MLNILPCELLILIANLLPAAGLWALSRASSRLYSVLAPLIYQSVTFHAATEWALNVLDIDSFFLHHDRERATRYLQHTKRLRLQAPIYLARFNRCAYYSIFRMAGLSERSATLGVPNDAVAHGQFLHDIMEQLLQVFARLKPNSLRSFQWRLGTCVPTGVLDCEGYISKNQAQLQSLTLVTDGTCPHACGRLDGLSKFSRLTTLGWEGIQHPAEVECLRKCIHQNRRHLSDLSVGFVSSATTRALRWKDFGSPWPAYVDDTKVNGSSPAAVPLLTALMLSKVTLPPRLTTVDFSVFCSLQSLTLRNCPNQLRLLHSLSTSHHPPQLKRFEACFDFLLYEPGEQQYSSVVARFLCSFRGLQDLYLRLSNFPESEFCIQDGIRHHQSTLKTLIYHERKLIPIDADGLFEDDRDVLPGWIIGLHNIVDLGQMTALGVCASPAATRLFLKPTHSQSKLQVLHLRFNGPDRIHRNIAQEIVTLLRKTRRDGSNHVTNPFLADHLVGGPRESDSLDLAASTLGVDTPDPELGFTEADEFLSFAEWAFSPHGLPSLQVIAFGDFSHGDRYRAQQFLLRRSNPAHGQNRFRAYGPTRCSLRLVGDLSDPDIWSDISMDGLRFVSACPGTGLMESPYDF